MTSQRTYYTTAEAAERLTQAGIRTTQRQVQRWVTKNQIEHTLLPNRRAHIPASAIDALIANETEPAA